jgi:NADH-quinone oxidoreductase subunit H
MDPQVFNWITMVSKVLFVVVVFLQVVPIMVWVERRGSALMQNRLGPNRVGPLGLLQSLADVVKFLWKEAPIPGHADPFYYTIAPLVSLIPAFMTFAVVPFASSIDFGGGKVLNFQMADLNVGLLYVFSIASLGVYGIILAGWSSNNKFALLGSLRSTSQMISYELSMGLSIIPLLMIFSSVHLQEIVVAQGATLIQLGPIAIPKWGALIFPVGPISFLIFLTAVHAETNRLPFDLPEGESELVAGYHLEFGAMRFALFMMAEYLNMVTASGLITTLFFGGWQLLPGMGLLLEALPLTGLEHEWARIAFEFASFSIKLGFFMWLFVWTRWTLPRFRFDQVMDLGWRVMLPLSLVNILFTGIMIYMGWI